jgi:hypothetical protein
MTRPLNAKTKLLLDGELTFADLPPDLHAEADAALAMIDACDRSPVVLSSDLEARVMAEVRRAAARRGARVWRWLVEPRDVRVRVRPWMLGPVLAAAAALVVLLARQSDPGSVVRSVDSPDTVFVRFVLYAPEAQRVTLAGTFNGWDASALPLVRGADAGVWVTTVPLAPGQHQYGFVIDGERWVADPAAPRVADGFGKSNSVVAVVPGERVL